MIVINVLETLRKQFTSLTDSEKKIAQYTLDNSAMVPRQTIKEFAQQAGVSEASIVRFCKRIGIKGFKEFKLALLKELTEQGATDSFNVVTKADLSDYTVQDIFNNVLFQDTQGIDKLVHTLDLKQIEEATAYLCRPHVNVLCYGAGASAIVAEDLTHKLVKLGIHTLVHRDFHYLLSLVINLKAGDVLIAISTTGETKELLELVELAKERGVIIIGITTFQKSHLSQSSDVLLGTPVLEDDFRIGNMATRISQLAVVDVLYMTLYRQFYPEVKEKYYELRQAVTRYRR